jgi:hypothetical protein
LYYYRPVGARYHHSFTKNISERSYYQSKIIEYRSNLRKSWKIINEVINRKKRKNIKNEYLKINGLRSADPVKIANHFNDYFTDIGHNLDLKLKTTLTDPLTLIRNKQINCIYLKPCTQDEIDKIIQNLKLCASGWDGIPASIIQENCDIFSLNLKYIINLSLCQGVFPNELKLANLIPIFKAGDMEEAGNYRPVSLLTT